MEQLEQSMLELITQTSTNLPPDVRRRMGDALAAEVAGSQAASALEVMAVNVDMALADGGPICQDTGLPTLEIRTPMGTNQLVMKEKILAALAEATRRGKLRPNSVDSITGKNSGNNLGPGSPVCIGSSGRTPAEIEVKLLLERRRMRKQEHPVFRPLRPAPSREGRPNPGWGAQMHPARGLAGSGSRLRSGGHRRVHRRRSHTSGYQHAKEQLFRLSG